MGVPSVGLATQIVQFEPGRRSGRAIDSGYDTRGVAGGSGRVALLWLMLGNWYCVVRRRLDLIPVVHAVIALDWELFAGLGNIFIIPDQAAVGATYNANNAQNPTQDLGVVPRHEGDNRKRGVLLALRGCVAHRSRLHQPVPTIPGSGAVRRSYSQSMRPQGSDAH